MIGADSRPPLFKTGESMDYRIVSWEDVDELLRKLGEVESALGAVASQRDIEMNAIREKYAEEISALEADQSEIQDTVRAYCETQKQSFLANRKRRLVYGTLSYRTVASISVEDADITIQALKMSGWLGSVNVKESVDKAALARMSDDDLARIGAVRVVKDVLKIETKKG